MAVDMCTKNGRGGSGLINYYTLHRKRAYRSKPPIQEITDKISPSVSPPREDEDDDTLQKKRKLNHGVLQDSGLDWRVFAFESASGASDYSEKKQGLEESLARICKSEEALRGCGRSDNYEKLGEIGSGSYGTVYLARDMRTDEFVAIKELEQGMSVPTLREIDILRSLAPHRAIVAFKEVVTDDDSDDVYIVMEFAEYDLDGYLEEAEGYLTPADVKGLMLQLLEGVKFLHENRVMHRDLKPSNILVGQDGVLKICDFGLSRRIDAAGGLYGTDVGTGWYKAPELLRDVKGYSEAVDMWAVGCVMAEMLLRCARSLEDGQLARMCMTVVNAEGGDEGYRRLRGEFLPAEVVSEAGFDLLKRFLCFDHSKRITAEDALNHIWFKEDFIDSIAD